VTAQTTITGIVTDAGTPERFAMQNTVVLCSKQTESRFVLPKEKDGSRVCAQHIPGDSVTAIGTMKSGQLIADIIETKAPWAMSVDGTAVIQHVEEPASDHTTMLHADGYRIRITPKTKQNWAAPLMQGSMQPNVWLTYSGTQEVNGTVTATEVTFSQNELSNREQNRNKKAEFDPSTVKETDRQSGLSQAFLGVNAKRIPAYDNSQMQQRVSAIGARLIPAYQRSLPDTSPLKLNFRFQIVDKKLNDALTLTNGIILIPHQLVERLENDSQLAAVLADNIACAMEKQTFRMVPTAAVISNTAVAGAVAGAFVPGLGLVTGIGSGVAAAKMLKHAQEQSGRVSLTLLHDAGYDITQAPVAWWILSSTKTRTKIDIPYRASYLYTQLATTWRPVLEQPASKNSVKP
jgi:hypothetical protein